MIPAPIVCRYCGAFTGTHTMNDDGKSEKGEHEHRDDCIEVLYKRIMILEDAILND